MQYYILLYKNALNRLYALIYASCTLGLRTPSVRQPLDDEDERKWQNTVNEERKWQRESQNKSYRPSQSHESKHVRGIELSSKAGPQHRRSPSPSPGRNHSRHHNSSD